MKIIGADLISRLSNDYPDSQTSLNTWSQLMRANHFKHFNDLKQTFGSADYVRPYTVFNIAGNKYRLISSVFYVSATVFVKSVLTHAEYDKGKWKR